MGAKFCRGKVDMGPSWCWGRVGVKAELVLGLRFNFRAELVLGLSWCQGQVSVGVQLMSGSN